MMITIGISEFRSSLNSVLQKVQNGEIVALTIHGTEVAKLVPPDFARLSARRELTQLRETAIVGDVLAPLGEEWAADS